MSEPKRDGESIPYLSRFSTQKRECQPRGARGKVFGIQTLGTINVKFLWPSAWKQRDAEMAKWDLAVPKVKIKSDPKLLSQLFQSNAMQFR